MSGNYSFSTRDISRRLGGEMKEVLFDPRAVAGKEQEIYYMVYRNIEIVNGKIKYDVTEIPAGKVGKEFRKTFGHYHKNNLPEFYEVLEGHAYFLLQYSSQDPTEIKEAYIVEALIGEKMIVPPGYGHLTINVGRPTLLLANWIGLMDYDYEPYKKLHGGCYYILDGGQTIEFEKNKNYKTVPELKKLKLKKNLPELGLKKDNYQPILNLKNSPEKLDWLINPEKYKELLTIEKLYREL